MSFRVLKNNRRQNLKAFISSSLLLEGQTVTYNELKSHILRPPQRPRFFALINSHVLIYSLSQRQNLKQYHPFASYLQRRVFEPREELDKFYDTDFARKKASPTKIREAIRRFEKVLERKEAKLPEGAGLAYEVVQCI